MVILIVNPVPKSFLATEVGFLGGTVCWTVSPDLHQSPQLLSDELLHTATVTGQIVSPPNSLFEVLTTQCLNVTVF